MLSKAELRVKMIEERNNLSSDKKRIQDEVLFNKLINSTEYMNANVVFVFVSCKGEVDTHKFINHAIGSGKIVCVPKVISMKEGMIPVAIQSLKELRPNRLGILEPVSMDKKIDAENIELVIVPGLAFDKNGRRLGYGGGFYDRFLPFVKEGVPKIGIGYDFQIIESVPSEAHDFLLNYTITN